MASNSCCIVSGCTTTNQTEKRELFPLPDPKKVGGKPTYKRVVQKRRASWLKNLGLSEPLNQKIFVCSNHFVTGKPASNTSDFDRDWSPTLNLPNYVHNVEKETEGKQSTSPPVNGATNDKAKQSTATMSKVIKVPLSRIIDLSSAKPQAATVLNKLSDTVNCYEKKKDLESGKIFLKRVVMKDNNVLRTDLMEIPRSKMISLMSSKKLSAVRISPTVLQSASGTALKALALKAKAASNTAKPMETDNTSPVGATKADSSQTEPSIDHDYCAASKNGLQTTDERKADHNYHSKPIQAKPDSVSSQPKKPGVNGETAIAKPASNVSLQTGSQPKVNALVPIASPKTKNGISDSLAPPSKKNKVDDGSEGMEYILPDIAIQHLQPVLSANKSVGPCDKEACAKKIATLKNELDQKSHTINVYLNELRKKNEELDLIKEQVTSLRAQLEENTHALCAYLASQEMK